MANPSSLQQEFNRLSFLASIATGNSQTATSNKKTTAKLISVDSLSNPLSFQNGLNSQTVFTTLPTIGSNLSITSTQKLSNNPNGLNNSASVGQINSLLKSATTSNPLKSSTHQPPAILRRVNRSPKTSETNFKTTVGQNHVKLYNQTLDNGAQSMQQQSIIAPPVKSFQQQNGQTIILPANFAGVSGKVLIVNNNGKVPQAISLSQASSQVQNIQHVIQTQNTNKPVMLLPQPNNIRKIVTQKQNVSGQLPALQPVSLTSFQSIRPKINPQNVGNISAPAATMHNIVNSIPATRLSHNPVQSSVTISPRTVLLSTNNANSLATMPTVVTIPSAFDKTISEHLLTLEKTHPDLFVKDKGLVINGQHQQGGVLKTSLPVNNLGSSTKQNLQSALITQLLENQQQSSSTPKSVALQGALKQQLKQHQLQLQQQQQLKDAATNQQKKSILEQARQQHLIHQQQQQQVTAKQIQQTNELLLLQQQLIQQTQQVQNQKSNKTDATNTGVQQAKLQIRPQNMNLLQSSQQNAPLKLLSSLTNMVTQSVAATCTSYATQTVATSLNNTNRFFLVNPNTSLQQSMRPVLVQLPNGNAVLSTQLLNSSQLTASQLSELQKTLLQQNVQITPQLQKQQNTSVTATRVSVNKSLPLTPKMDTTLPKQSVFTTTKPPLKTNKAQVNIPQLVASTPAGLAPQKSQSLNEQIKSLSASQREQLLRQIASGKLNNSQLQLSGISNNILISSILQNSLVQKQPSSAQQQLRKQVLTAKGRGTKRALDTPPTEHRFSKKWKRILHEDHLRVVSPEYRLPFKTKSSAIKSLLPYHVLGLETEKPIKNNDKFELLFNSFAVNVQERKSWLLEKFNSIMFNEVQVACPSEEAIQISRLYISSETEKLNEQRKALNEGRAYITCTESGDLRYVDVSTTLKEEKEELAEREVGVAATTLHEIQPLDGCYRVAHKDIGNVELDDSEEEMEEAEDEIEFDPIAYAQGDNELAVATDNLLADLQQEDEYGFKFSSCH